jgi:hypothetical protein
MTAGERARYALEVCYLKRRAARVTRRYLRLMDNLDCGTQMASYLRPDGRRMLDERMRCLQRLREIDPQMPQYLRDGIKP